MENFSDIYLAQLLGQGAAPLLFLLIGTKRKREKSISCSFSPLGLVSLGVRRSRTFVVLWPCTRERKVVLFIKLKVVLFCTKLYFFLYQVVRFFNTTFCSSLGRSFLGDAAFLDKVEYLTKG